MLAYIRKAIPLIFFTGCGDNKNWSGKWGLLSCHRKGKRNGRSERGGSDM